MVVLTPLVELMAVLPNEAVTGIEEKKEARRLVAPRARNSWLASTGELLLSGRK